jgi:hypothetical protein
MMSEVLLDLVAPYETESFEDFRKLIMIGVVAWNAALMTPEKRAGFLEATAKTLPPEAQEDLITVINPLIQRKLKLYPNNTRMIADFRLTPTPTGPNLQVVSSLPGV